MKKLIFFLILLFPLVAMAETWEFAVAKQDKNKADCKEGYKCLEQYDVVAVMPKGHEWSDLEREHFLIVVVDGLTEDEAATMTKPLYKDGIEFTAERPGEIIGERRYKIDETVLKSQVESEASKTIYWNSAVDKTEDYQPLKDNNIVVDFKKEAGIYDKIEEKKVSVGTAELSAESIQVK
jgi:hypothetical protein